MIVMPANNTGIRVGWLAGKYPGRMAHLFSPGAQQGPFEFMEYALDNGAYGAFKSGKEWDEAAWVRLLDWARLSAIAPRWVLIPDVVGDRLRTLRRWEMYAPIAARYGWPLAFALQDGMVPTDVPQEASVVFVGGTTEWKWRHLAMWCKAFPRVHVGRVNTYRRLFQCYDAGAESGDGTGWTRGDQIQWRGLQAFFAQTSGEQPRPEQLTLEDHGVHIC